MNSMSRKINIRPSTGVYATYKNIKYDPWTAIAEFVDNSTQSYYDHVKQLESTKYWDGLDVEITYERDSTAGDRLIIRDNAFGMDFHDFQRAIVLDSPPKKKSRSEFGMGLKTAACWFGINWQVESTELGSDVKCIAAVDVDALHKYKNEEIEVQEITCSRKEHGTIITIWNLNRTVVGRQIKKTKDQLRGMYRIDLRSGKIRISYNGEQLLYEEPKALTEVLPDGSEKIWRKDIAFSVPYKDGNLPVSGFVSILEEASTSGAGFALIRQGRVIVGGYENAYRPEEIFGKSNDYAYQRIAGELSLDDWPVTQTKDAFDWYGGDLEDAFISRLKTYCEEYVKKARTWRKRKTTTTETVTNTLVTTLTNAGIIENATIENIDEQQTEIPDTTSEKGTFDPSQQPVGGTNNSEQIIGKENGEHTNTEAANIEATTSSYKDIQIDGPSGKKIQFSTSAGTFTFNLIMRKADPKLKWLVITPKSGENEYDIEWNIRHPFFKPYIDEPDFLSVMEQFVFALALAEIESIHTSVDGMVSASSVRMKMNDFLKDVADGGSIQ